MAARSRNRDSGSSIRNDPGEMVHQLDVHRGELEGKLFFQIRLAKDPEVVLGRISALGGQSETNFFG